MSGTEHIRSEAHELGTVRPALGGLCAADTFIVTANMEHRAVAAPGSNLKLEPLESSDAARLIGFGGSPGTHYLCRGAGASPGGSGGLGARLVLRTRDGRIVAAGMVEPTDVRGQAGVTVVVSSAYQHDPAVVNLIETLASRARQLGYRRLMTCVPRAPHNGLDSFRAAGLRMVSSLSLGGVTEVALELD